MNAQPTTLKVAVCSPTSYGPSSKCVPQEFIGVSPNEFTPETWATSSVLRDRKFAAYNSKIIHRFLAREWSRTKTLGRDPYSSLGENPPW